jgi:hypothetical protein
MHRAHDLQAILQRNGLARALRLVINRNDQTMFIPRRKIMELVLLTPVFAEAAGYSLVYLLGGGGIMGALVIFVVAKMLGQ